MNYVILIAEDDLIGRETLVEAFTERGYKVRPAVDGNAAMSILQSEEIDLVITDLVMPGVDGMRLLEAAVTICPVILITAHGTVDNAVQAMKLGAFDFVTKPIHLPHLFALTERALQMTTLARENEALRQRVEDVYDFANMIGRAPVMRTVFQQIKQVASADTTVCILGDSGTGKELVANAIHQHSRRADRPYNKVNCAAISENLLESELFGHEKGAFTGAIKQRKGRFERAHGGTLLLDEISEMSPALQAKLLRVLQGQEFERVGGNEMLKVDARVLVATNADLKAKIQEGSFREDLYYRVSVFPIQLPPLRDRRDDIPLLVDHFLRQQAQRMNKSIDGIRPDALDVLVQYDWPGNIRELQNAIERACVIVAEGKAISRGHLPPEVIQPTSELAGVDPAHPAAELPDTTMDELERMAIEQALVKCNGNRTKAAKTLNIGVKTLYRKVEKYGIRL